MTIEPSTASRSTSVLMRSRDSTANLPAPETTRREPRRRRGVEGAADGGEGTLLAVEVGAVGRGRRHQHRARRLARDPDAVIDPRRARRRQRFGDAQRLAGRVAKEDRLEQRAGRRAEQRDGRVDRLAQAGRAEALGVDGRTDRIAVLEQEAAGVGPGRVLAVVDRREGAARAQCRGHAPRRLGARDARPHRRRARRLRCR